MKSRPRYPFAAIVAQDRMKKALLLNAVDPAIGGVLVRGEKGTAKSTAARALAALLPQIEAVDCACAVVSDPAHFTPGCPECLARTERGEAPAVSMRGTPFVELPLGATEDRVMGSIDVERAIARGERRFEPGVLAAADRGVLYVDEVNLLEDHLVDVLLDAAAMGVNTVEREGVSYSHPARFILIGSMNPEEGELRPQLLDRFGLCVEVAGIESPRERAEVVRRRLRFEADPGAFAAEWAGEDEATAARVLEAKKALASVRCDDATIERIAAITVEMGVHGHRADITMVKTARAIAALDGRAEVAEEDVRAAAELALPHRMRRNPFDEPTVRQDRLDEAFSKNPPSRNDSAEGRESPL